MPAWEDHVHKKIVIAALIAKKKGTMGGRRSLSSFMTNLPQSAGISLFEGDDLPTAESASYANGEIISRDLYARIAQTGQVQRAARKGDKVAWAQPKGEELAAMRKQADLNFARKLYLGRRDLMGKIVSESSATYTLFNRDSRTGAAADRHNYGAHYLRVGMRVDHVATVAGDLVGTARRIESMDLTSTNPTVTLSAAFGTGTPADDWLVPSGSRRSSANDNDDGKFGSFNGLLDMAVDSNYHQYLYDLDRTSVTTLNGHIVNGGDGGNVPFDEEYLNLAHDRIVNQGTGDDPDTVVCNESIRREYVKTVRGDRRFPEVIKQRGYGTLKQVIGDNSLPIVTDRDCPPGLMFMLETDGFGWLSQSEWGLLDQGERFVANKDIQEWNFHKSGNCMTQKPHNNALIENLAYSQTGISASP